MYDFTIILQEKCRFLEMDNAEMDWKNSRVDRNWFDYFTECDLVVLGLGRGVL